MLRKVFHHTLVCSNRSYSRAVAALKREKNTLKPVITCKRPSFNCYKTGIANAADTRFGQIPLVSDGWSNRRSKGDYFVINPMNDSQPEPTETFAELQVLSEITDSLKKDHGIEKPTFIQSKAIPQVFSGGHTLIAAETGCGKTYAYLIPIIQQIAEEKKRTAPRRFNTPLGLILTPGRELAHQIGNIAEEIGRMMNVSVKVVIGGNTKKVIMSPDFDNIDLLIGTMGTTSKLVTTGIFRMNEVRHVVLDEADTLLDDSFTEKLRHFLKKFPFYRNELPDMNDGIHGTQLVLVSATMPTNTTELLQMFIDPDTVQNVVSPNLHRILSHIPQRFLRMSKTDRPTNLLSLVKLELDKKNPVIVFANQSVTSDFISLYLNENGIECVNLNGDMQMRFRIGKFETFQTGDVNVLATTDICSRGLDTTRAKHIVNFDFPLHIADYIHRCGRIGRTGQRHNHSMITNFITSQREIDVVRKIEHTARTSRVLTNVNGNISGIIRDTIMKSMADDSNMLP